MTKISHQEAPVYSIHPQNETQVKPEFRDFCLPLKYMGTSRLELRGSVTGELYSFSSLLPVHSVDLRDAKFLLASPLFTIAQ